MNKKLGVVMDAIERIHYKKDSTLAMLLEAERRGYDIYYFQLQDLMIVNGEARGQGRKLKVFADEHKWYDLQTPAALALADLDIILMRKDPPFNENYIYATYILELAEQHGTVVVNKPQTLRDANEKIFATHFAKYCPPHLVSQDIGALHAFWREYQDIVVKPLDSMGGQSIFRINAHDANVNVILETLTHGGKSFIMAQQFLPEISAGDKRILLINGEAVPHVLARVPQANDWRGNLAAGAKGIVQPLSARDHEICNALRPTLKSRGLYFVGIDVIGDYLTEINITSPTGIREIESATHLNLCATLFDSFA